MLTQGLWRQHPCLAGEDVQRVWSCSRGIQPPGLAEGLEALGLPRPDCPRILEAGSREPTVIGVEIGPSTPGARQAGGVVRLL
jgi:hypothetical protein